MAMARAFKLGIEAGRLAWEAGFMARQERCVRGPWLHPRGGTYCAEFLGRGPTRPVAGFALDSDNLPHFSTSGQADGLDFTAPINSDLGLNAIVDSAAWVLRVLQAGVRTVQLLIKNPAQATLHRTQAKQMP